MSFYATFGRSTSNKPHNSYVEELDAEQTAPLLPEHHHRHEETALQASLHHKLHGFLMLKALKDGYLPSTEQFVAIVDSFLKSEIFAQENWRFCGRDTREFIKLLKKYVEEVKDLVEQKNNGDELQDIIWWGKKARMEIKADVDLERVNPLDTLRAGVSTELGNVSAAYGAIQTLFDLLLQNTDFQNLLQEVGLIARQVFADTATATAKTLESKAEEVAPDVEAVVEASETRQARPPAEPRLIDENQVTKLYDTTFEMPSPPASTSGEGENLIKSTAEDISNTLTSTAETAVKKAVESASENASTTSPLGRHLRQRVRELIINLRRDSNYVSSVSILELLLKSYLKTYLYATVGGVTSSVVGGITDAVDIEVDASKNNAALARTAMALYTLVGRFGDKGEWRELGKRIDDLLKHVVGDGRGNSRKEVDKVVDRFVEGTKELLVDPEIWVGGDEEQGEDEVRDKRLPYIRRKIQNMLNINEETSLPAVRRSLDDVLSQIQAVYVSVKNDKQVHKVIGTSGQLIQLLFPPSSSNKSTKFGMNAVILHDTQTTLFPVLLSLLQIIPIPRLTLTSPQLDLLLENLYIEPGHTVYHSSFFPYNFTFTQTSEVSITKNPAPDKLSHTFYAGFKRNTVNLTIRGVTFRARDVGYIMKLKSGLGILSWLGLKDKGIASVEVDKEGIDIHLTIDILTSRSLNGDENEPVESSLLKLRKVKVDINRLKYTLRKSRFSWLFGFWPMKSIIANLLKKVIASQLEESIREFSAFSNRELAYARERFRGARITNPSSLYAWFKAVKYRVWDAPIEPPPEISVAIGVSSVGTAQEEREGYKGRKGKGVFQGEYAPGSVVQLWEEDLERSGEVLGRYAVVNGGGDPEGSEHVGERRRLKEGGWGSVVFDKQGA